MLWAPGRRRIRRTDPPLRLSARHFAGGRSRRRAPAGSGSWPSGPRSRSQVEQPRRGLLALKVQQRLALLADPSSGVVELLLELPHRAPGSLHVRLGRLGLQQRRLPAHDRAHMVRGDGAGGGQLRAPEAVRIPPAVALEPLLRWCGLGMKMSHSRPIQLHEARGSRGARCRGGLGSCTPRRHAARGVSALGLRPLKPA